MLATSPTGSGCSRSCGPSSRGRGTTRGAGSRHTGRRSPCSPWTRAWRGWRSKPTASGACTTSSSSSRRCRSRTRASGHWSSRRQRRCRTSGLLTSTPTSSPTCGCGTTCRSSRRRCPAALFGACARASSSTTCGSGSGRTSSGSSGRPARVRDSSSADETPRMPKTLLAPVMSTPSTGRCCPACSARSASATRPSATTLGHAAPASGSRRARACSRSNPRSSWPASSSRRRACGRTTWPGSTRSGPRS